MVGESCAALPVDTHLHAWEIWARLLGIALLDMGQSGTLHWNISHNLIRVPSHKGGMEPFLRGPLHEQELGLGSH